MKALLFLVLAMLLSLAMLSQIPTVPCQVKLKAGKTSSELKLFYTGSVLADSIAIENESGISRGDMDSLISNFNGTYYTTFHRILAFDSAYVFTPAANLYYQDSLVCSIAAKWHRMDTLANFYTNLSTSKPVENNDRQQPFIWVKGERPKVEVSIGCCASVGDIITVTFTTNFPIKELTDRLQSPILMKESIKATQTKVSSENGRPSVQYFLQTIEYRVINMGIIAFEPVKFKLSGKKVKMPAVVVNIE